MTWSGVSPACVRGGGAEAGEATLAGAKMVI